MNKIRLYDFLSFLLPGLLVSCTLTFFFSYVIPLLPEGLKFEDLGSLGSSIIFLIIAFLIGHATQVFGNEFEIKQIKYWGKKPLRTAKYPEKKMESGFTAAFVSFWVTILPVLRFVPLIRNRIRAELGLIPSESGGGWYSRQLLRPEDDTYDAETKKSIREGAEKILGVPFVEENDCISQTSDTDKKLADRKNQMIFERAYRFILLKNIAPQTDDFNSQYGFYRGNCVAFLFIVWLSLVSIIIFAAKSFLAWKHMGISPAFWQNLDHVKAAIIAFLISDGLFFLFRRRYERFAFYFSNSVYQNFLVWWLSEKRIMRQVK